MKKDASISECGKYRYVLTREWDESRPQVLFIMLNPSTADALEDDPTIRRCIAFAKRWGFGGLIVCNLFAFRATNPLELLNTEDPQGPDNLNCLEYYSQICDKIICAWGNYPLLKRIKHQRFISEFILQRKHKLYYLELSKNKTPKHPLYLKSDLLPKKLL